MYPPGYVGAVPHRSRYDSDSDSVMNALSYLTNILTSKVYDVATESSLQLALKLFGKLEVKRMIFDQVGGFADVIRLLPLSMAMDARSSNSLFTHIASRELFRGFSLSNSIFTGKLSRRFLTLFLCQQFENDRVWTDSSPLSTKPDTSPYSTTPKIPFLSLSFGKTTKFAHILAVSDEDGYVSLFDTRPKCPLTSNFEENTEEEKICYWVSHQNAVFDICWIKEDMQILTASGDQTIKLWDVQEQKCLEVLIGHMGSVKSMCPHPTNADIIVSGSRDGSFRIWDLRCKSTAKSRRREVNICSMGGVNGAHVSSQARRTRRGKDQVSVATAGAVDRIYLYNTLQLEKGPGKSFSGCRIESFFVKSVINPDVSNIVSGSSDGNAYVWKVDKPLEDHTILKTHDGEVTAVNWCSSKFGKFATCSDDFTYRVLNNGKTDEDAFLPNHKLHPISSSTPITPPKVNFLSEGHTNQLPSSGFDPNAASQKTPESTLKSPSSVY
ncbi:Threonine dehydratase [Vigna angularis]|uniref:Threonine dehydratase n=1 Tax=Phaseolus angularis TaxID=3914 RepID=A0A8T0KKR7_PHAAN|nr:Threonine dehydratase [Vigna angularis]